MKILDFIEKTKLADRSESEKAKLLCFFLGLPRGSKHRQEPFLYWVFWGWVCFAVGFYRIFDIGFVC